MQNDPAGEYRRVLLEADARLFSDRVDTPWEAAPDVFEFNSKAFKRVDRTLQQMERERQRTRALVESEKGCGCRPQSQGILVLGMQGTGKSHLLMRVAQRFAGRHLMVFVPRPVDEENVMVRIWQQLLDSLCHRVPGNDVTQLELLLANVVSRAAIAEMQREIDLRGESGRDKRRLINQLTDDPFCVFEIEGADRLRRKAYNFVTRTFPDVQTEIVDALLKYVVTKDERHRGAILDWLAGQTVRDGIGNLKLRDSWLVEDLEASVASRRARRNELAFQAIRTVGFMSTMYHTMVLSFDQLEGLRQDDKLTLRWGNAVQDIISYAPNFVVVSCMFPDLWEEHFQPLCLVNGVGSYLDRIAGRTVRLDEMTPEVGRHLIARSLTAFVGESPLPTETYPFDDVDINRLCPKGSSVRQFIQRIRDEFEEWLFNYEDEADSFDRDEPIDDSQQSWSLESAETESLILNELTLREGKVVGERDAGHPQNAEEIAEQIQLILSFCFTQSDLSVRRIPSEETDWPLEATCYQSPDGLFQIYVSVTGKERTAFYYEIQKLAEASGEGTGRTGILIRDMRCKSPGQRSLDGLDQLCQKHNRFVQASLDELLFIRQLALAIRDVENHDFEIACDRTVDRHTFFVAVSSSGFLCQSHIIRSVCAAAPWAAPALGCDNTGFPSDDDQLTRQLIFATDARRNRVASDPSLNKSYALGALTDHNLQITREHVRACFRDVSPTVAEAVRCTARGTQKSRKHLCEISITEVLVAAELKMKDQELVVNIWGKQIRDANLGNLNKESVASMRLVYKPPLDDLHYSLLGVLGRNCSCLRAAFEPGPKYEYEPCQTLEELIIELHLDAPTKQAIRQVSSQPVTYLASKDADSDRRYLAEAVILFNSLWNNQRALFTFQSDRASLRVLDHLGNLINTLAGALPEALVLGESSRSLIREIGVDKLPFDWQSRTTNGAAQRSALLISSLNDLSRALSPSNQRRISVSALDCVIVDGVGEGDMVPSCIAASLAKNQLILGGEWNSDNISIAIPSISSGDWFEKNPFELAGFQDVDSRLVRV